MTEVQNLNAEKLLADLIDQLKPVVTNETAIVGIYTGGVWLAERLHQALGVQVPLGTLDVSFYRDDYEFIGLHPQTRPSGIPFEVAGRHIILVDDILYTGRTIRAAMHELFDYGRPSSIRLAILVDRGGRQLPIAAEFIGATIQLPVTEDISLEKDDQGKLKLFTKPSKRSS